MKKSIAILSLLVGIVILTGSFKPRDKNQLERVWYNQEKTSKIEVFLATDGKFYGKIVWLKEPNDAETGKPRLDKENPEEKLQNTPLMGLLILKGFAPTAEDKNVYEGGKIYDPKNGKTYCGKITFKGTTLDLRGYLCSASFLGRTSTWTLAE
jgi:uncharacterized protein (DUF2147 family)